MTLPICPAALNSARGQNRTLGFPNEMSGKCHKRPSAKSAGTGDFTPDETSSTRYFLPLFLRKPTFGEPQKYHFLASPVLNEASEIRNSCRVMNSWLTHYTVWFAVNRRDTISAPTYTRSMDAYFVAFFSYTHADDEIDHGILSKIRERLEKALQANLGSPGAQVFQDRDDIELGDLWEARLTKATDEAVFLIPIITPSFYNSKFCRMEFMRFWSKAKANPESARIIPILWRDGLPVGDVAGKDAPEVIEAVKALQHDDWQNLRLHDVKDREMRQKIEELARLLADRYQSTQAELAKAEAERVCLFAVGEASRPTTRP